VGRVLAGPAGLVAAPRVTCGAKAGLSRRSSLRDVLTEGGFVRRSSLSDALTEYGLVRRSSLRDERSEGGP
jgi:hypothetical protein